MGEVMSCSCVQEFLENNNEKILIPNNNFKQSAISDVRQMDEDEDDKSKTIEQELKEEPKKVYNIIQS